MEASSIAVHAAKLVAANKADDVIKVTDRAACCKIALNFFFFNNEFSLNTEYLVFIRRISCKENALFI